MRTAALQTAGSQGVPEGRSERRLDRKAPLIVPEHAGGEGLLHGARGAWGHTGRLRGLLDGCRTTAHTDSPAAPASQTVAKKTIHLAHAPR